MYLSLPHILQGCCVQVHLAVGDEEVDDESVEGDGKGAEDAEVDGGHGVHLHHAGRFVKG